MNVRIFFIIVSFLAAFAGALRAEDPDVATDKIAGMAFAGKTMRFDERKLDQRVNALPERINKYIVYFDPDGTAFIWFPGQAKVIARQWEVSKGGTLTVKSGAQLRYLFLSSLCFSGSTGQSPLCRYGQHLEISLKEEADGDIFDLGSLKVPCRLCRGDVVFSDVRKTKGGG